MFKIRQSFPSLSEDQFIMNLQKLLQVGASPYNSLSLFKKDLITRLIGVAAAAHYIHKLKGTDEVEYRAFLSGLNHAIDAINKVQI